MSADVSERQQAEAELARFIHDHAGEQHAFLALAEAIPQLVWTTCPEGGLDYCNQRALDHLGLTLGTVWGWGWASILHPADRPVCLDRWKKALADGEGYDIESRFRVADGSYRWFLCRALPVRDRQGRIIKWFGTSTDIEVQKQAEARIARLNEQLQRRIAELKILFDVLPVGIAIAEDPACDRVRFNRHFVRHWGLAGDENFSPNRPAEERPGGFRVFRDGVEVPVGGLPMQVAAARGVEVLGEELDLLLGDGRVVNLLVDAAPLFDEQGRPRGSVAAVQDITERKRTEEQLRAAKEAAEAANRSKDQFLALLSQELRTPLTPILMTATAMRDDPATPPELRQSFETIRQGVELQARLIDDLLEPHPNRLGQDERSLGDDERP